MKSRLHELAEKYSSDKLYRHSYLPYYEKLFSEIRYIARVLEVGIGYEDLMRPFLPPDVPFVQGSSLLMWEEYWPGASIFACDIRTESLVNGGAIQSIVCDQSKPIDLLNLIRWSGGLYDIVIDDGSHQAEHQIITAAALMPQVRWGGVYIVEDVQQPERIRDAIGGEIIRFNKCSDDCLVVVRL